MTKTSFYLSPSLRRTTSDARNRSGRLAAVCDRYLWLYESVFKSLNFTPDDELILQIAFSCAPPDFNKYTPLRACAWLKYACVVAAQRGLCDGLDWESTSNKIGRCTQIELWSLLEHAYFRFGVGA